MAMPVSEMNARFQRIASGWMSAMPEGEWTSASLFWGQAADLVYSAATALDLEGQPRSVSLPKDVHDAFVELREGMAEPDRGTWLSASARIDPDGVFEVNWNWDRRWFWGEQAGFPWQSDPGQTPIPSDAQWLDDLARHPREPMHLPAWYPRPAVEAGATPAGAERFRAAIAAPGALSEEARPLMDAWGWPGIVELARTTSAQALGRIEPALADAIAGERGSEAQREALAEFRDGVTGGVMASLERSPALVAIRLRREWAATREESGDPAPAEPAGLEAFDDDRPLASCRGEAPVAAVVEELEGVVRRLVQADLAARFGVESS